MIWSTVLQSQTVAGNTVTVDAVYGNDTSGKRGVASLPFLTLGAAKAAAQSGDLVWVRPGSYTVTDSILKNGVNWHFQAGASVGMSQTSGEAGIFFDKNVAITSTISGDGDFTMTVLAAVSGNALGAVVTQNASTNLVIHARTIGCQRTDITGTAYPVTCWFFAGSVRIECSHSIWAEDSSSIQGGTVVAWATGTQYIRAPLIYCNGNVVLPQTTGTAADNLYIVAEQIYSDGTGVSGNTGGMVLSTGSNANAAIWISSQTFQANIGSGYCAIQSFGSEKIYLACQKLYGFILCGGGLVYVEAQKVEALANVGSLSGAVTALFVECSGGTLRYNVGQHDPKTFTGIGLLIDGGIMLDQGKIEYTAGSGSDGLSISSGTADLTSAYLNTAANASGFPIVKSGGTLILRGGTLVSSGTVKSINAGTAQNVVAMGAWANNSVNSNVTIVTTGGLTINSNVQ